MSWKRWALLIGGGLISALIIGIGVLTYLVLRLDIRGEVERAVENATGRDLVISGSVGVSYWPVLGLRAGDVTLANVEGGRAEHFIVADEIDIGVELRPLLDRDVVVRRLVIQRPRIALEVDAQGAPNWILQPRRAEGPAPTPTPGTPTVRRTSLREVRINEGDISFFDARRGQGWVLGQADLTTDVTSLDAPVRVEGDFVYNDRPINIDLRLERPSAVARGQSSPLRLNIESDLIGVSFDGQTVGSSGEIAGAVRASGPSLRQLTAWVGSPIQGGAGFERFEVSGRLAVGDGRYEFSNAGFIVDLVRGRGDFVLSELRNKPYISGRLELFDFDLNPYLTGQTPPATEAPPPAQTAASAPTAEIAAVEAPPRAVDMRAAPGEQPIDFSGLQGFNADLELVTRAVLVQHMRVDSGRLNLVINDGYLAATLHNLTLYGGSGRGRFEIDARNAAAGTRMVQDLTFERVDARRFLGDAVNLRAIEGRGEVSIDIRTQGRTQTEMLANSDGRIHVEVVSGVLHGVDLGGVATTIRNALRGELIAPEARTPFQGFSATFAVADGVLASDDVSFNTEDLRIPGIAVIDVPNRRVDARLAPRSPRGGVVFPFAVRGPWLQLTYAADTSDRAQNEIITRVRQVEAASRAQ